MGFLFTGSVGLLPQWFTKRRSLANSIGTAGSGFGGLTYSLATNAMISQLGLAWAFRILAILAFVVNGGCSFLARDRNKEVGAVHQAFHKELFKKLELYLFLAWGFFSILGYIIVVFSLASYASVVGYTATQGSILAAIFNCESFTLQRKSEVLTFYTVSQGLGRPLIGFYSDRVGRINVAGLSALFAGLAAFFLWIFAGGYYAGAIVYSLFGLFAGSIWPVIAPVAVEVIGLQLLPSGMLINALNYVCMVLLTISPKSCPLLGLYWFCPQLSQRSLASVSSSQGRVGILTSRYTRASCSWAHSFSVSHAFSRSKSKFGAHNTDIFCSVGSEDMEASYE